jgi:hypothetical protein
MNSNIIQFQLKDCREDLIDLGKFDVVHLGFAVKNISRYMSLLNDEGVLFAAI